MADEFPAADPDGAEVWTEPDTPELPVQSVAEQFPAVDDTPEGAQVEVERRQVDNTPDTALGRFVREFRVGRLAPADDDPEHERNAVAVVQDAVQRGLHPHGDVYLTGVEEHDEPLNEAGTRRRTYTVLRYEVDVVPASTDTHPAEVTTPRVIHQARGDTS